MLDDVVVVGFDATDDAQKAVKEGDMDATIGQQPKPSAEKAVEAAGKVANGEELAEFIPVALEMVTESRVCRTAIFTACARFTPWTSTRLRWCLSLFCICCFCRLEKIER